MVAGVDSDRITINVDFSMQQGTLFIIAAPSGGGKTSLVRALCEKDCKVLVSISHTTRPMRPDEKNGVAYHFIDQETFLLMQQNRQFLENAIVFAHYYGTSQAWVEQQLANDQDIILEIDWQGAKQVKQKMPESIGIFILPPSKKILEERLRNRAQDHHNVIAARMAQAVSEMSHYAEFDYIVINNDFDRALNDLYTIICAQRLAKNTQVQNQQLLIDALIK